MSRERQQRILEILDEVLKSPPERRDAYLDKVCVDDSELRSEVETRLRTVMRERQRRVLEILDEALELPSEQRDSYLDDACVDDPELRREVEARLHTVPSEDWETPMFDIHADDDQDVDRMIGPYRLVRLLDRGGMGAVHLARRDDLGKNVALKIILRGLNLDDVFVARFENERRILAQLEHPFIARLIDSGATDDNVPWFAMEYVEGEAIDRYCKKRDLSIEERIELFCDVCSAVQYAHRHLVVHRDLKPSNILITEDGTPKLLDFGIARLIDQGSSSVTRTGGAVMTTRYASPEQIRGESVSTVSDVYSLGVLLYLLLTGSLPHVEDTESGLIRAVLDGDVEKPSRVVEDRDLQRRLKGDLDQIVLKALRDEPQERYAGVQQLADDLRRHLDGLPIHARTANLSYTAGKLIRRHRFAAISALAFFVLILGFTITSFFLMREAEYERRRAAEENSKFHAAFEIIVDEIGDTKASVRLLENVIGLAPEGDHDETAKLLNNLGYALFEAGDYSAAEDQFRQALEMRLNLGQSGIKLFRVRNNIASSLSKQGKHKDAELIYREVLEERLKINGPDDKDVATSYRSLAAVLLAQGLLEEAERLASEALRIRTSAYGEKDPKTVRAQELLGRIFAAQRRFQEADSQLKQALSILLEQLGAQHRDVKKVTEYLEDLRQGQPEVPGDV